MRGNEAEACLIYGVWVCTNGGQVAVPGVLLVIRILYPNNLYGKHVEVIQLLETRACIHFHHICCFSALIFRNFHSQNVAALLRCVFGLSKTMLH